MSTKTTANAPRRLVLASTSRYRATLLERLGLPFLVAAPGVDEAALPGEAPSQTALRLAEAKARAVAVRFPEALVIGSDQIAVGPGKTASKTITVEPDATALGFVALIREPGGRNWRTTKSVSPGSQFTVNVTLGSGGISA